MFTGAGFGMNLRNYISNFGASIFAIPVNDPSNYGIVEFNEIDVAISLEEKPMRPKSNFAIPGLYFLDNRASLYSSKLVPSKRGELEMLDLLDMYLKNGDLKVNQLRRGLGWLDAGTTENLFLASELVRIHQVRQGMRIGVPEEIAFNNGWISTLELSKLATGYRNTEYGDYLLRIMLQND